MKSSNVIKRKSNKSEPARKYTKLNPGLRSYVKRVMSSDLEQKKYLALNPATVSVAVADGTAQPYTQYCLPVLDQGTGNYQRTGNVVSLIAGNVEGFIKLRPYNATTNTQSNVWVRCWIVRYKRSSITPVTASTFLSFFEGTSTSTTFTGEMGDMLSPINLDAWDVYAEKLLYISNSSNSANFPSASTFHDSGGQYSQHFKFELPIVSKKLMYDDTNNVPQNNNLFLIIQAVAADNSTQIGPICDITGMKVHWKFTDA